MQDDLLEDNIKNSVLQNKSIFNHLGKLGNDLIIYEKKIYGGVITDCLIFTQYQGIIGVEIKTQHDTLRRLPRQLDSYVKTCRYIYVYCHDSKVKGVKDLLKQKHYEFVGIISYTEFDHVPVPGLVRQAKISPFLMYQGYTSLLWKDELKKILYVATNTKQYDRINKLKFKYNQLFPSLNGEQLVANFYINNYTDPRKRLQKYHFGNYYYHDVTFRGGRYS